MATTFEVKGLKETLEVFEQLRNDIGDKKATSKVLIPAVREAMKPVLAMAKALSPKDTGTLDRSLYITARRPSGKDKQSRYVKYQDSVISLVSTKPIPKSLKNKFKASHGHLKGAEYKSARKAYFAEQGYLADDGLFDLLKSPEERELLRFLNDLNQIIVASCEQNKPSLLCHHLFDTCKVYNRLLANNSVLRAESDGLRSARLALLDAFSQGLKQGLSLLGIVPPERM